MESNGSTVGGQRKINGNVRETSSVWCITWAWRLIQCKRPTWQRHKIRSHLLLATTTHYNFTALSGIGSEVLGLSDTEPVSLKIFRYFPPTSCVTLFLSMSSRITILKSSSSCFRHPPSPSDPRKSLPRVLKMFLTLKPSFQWYPVTRIKENLKWLTYAKFPTA